MDYKFKNISNAVFNTNRSDLSFYNGETVLVLHPLLEYEYNRKDVGNMYKIRLPDGQVIDVYEEELI